MAKTILKQNGNKAVVKLHGSGLSETIRLNTDLLLPTEALTVGGTPTVTIAAVHWTGELNAIATIKRNGITIFDLQANAAAQMFFQDQEFTDSVESTGNIVITSTGSMQIYLILKKVTGYSSKIETSEFSVYDDTSVVGS